MVCQLEFVTRVGERLSSFASWAPALLDWPPPDVTNKQLQDHRPFVVLL